MVEAGGGCVVNIGSTVIVRGSARRRSTPRPSTASSASPSPTRRRSRRRSTARELVRELVAEGRAVADALGITLDGDSMELIDDAAQPAAGHQPSMLQDVLARRTTEIGVRNEGVVRMGREVAVPTLRHQAVVALIHGLGRSWSAPR
jgi:ketopantoate reductase